MSKILYPKTQKQVDYNIYKNLKRLFYNEFVKTRVAKYVILSFGKTEVFKIIANDKSFIITVYQSLKIDIQYAKDANKKTINQKILNVIKHYPKVYSSRCIMDKQEVLYGKYQHKTNN